MSSALDTAVTRELQAGAKLESLTPTTAVLTLGGNVNHVLHLILSLLTAGLWLIVWAIMVLTAKKQRIVLTLDDSGTVSRHVTTS